MCLEFSFGSLPFLLLLLVLQRFVFSLFSSSTSRPASISVARKAHFGSSSSGIATFWCKCGTQSTLWKLQLENRSCSTHMQYTKYSLAAPVRTSQLLGTSVVHEVRSGSSSLKIANCSAVVVFAIGLVAVLSSCLSSWPGCYPNKLLLCPADKAASQARLLLVFCLTPGRFAVRGRGTVLDARDLQGLNLAQGVPNNLMCTYIRI